MKIIHAFTTNRRAAFTGIESHVLSLATAQKAAGHSPIVMTDDQGYFTEACAQHDIPLIVEPGLDGAGIRRPAEPTTDSPISQFTSYGAQVIHCHTVPAALQAIPVGNRASIPCFFTLHAPGERGAQEIARLKHLDVSVISVSRAGMKTATKLGIPEASIYFAPNGTRVMPNGRRVRYEPFRPDLIIVASLGWAKGIDIAVLAMSVLKRRLGGDCPALSIYGDGPTAIGQNMKEAMDILDLNNIVSFYGNHPGILARCPATDILVVSSREETGPIVVLEAMSRGMPVVTTRVGEVTEMLPDDRYGRIVPPESIVALADGIESMLADVAGGKFDPELPIARHQSLFTDEIMAECNVGIYKKVLQV